MKHYNVKERLIDGAIKVIARDGMDKATTKAITTETKLYETYIYQHFKNKDGLLVAAFEKLDEELLFVTTSNLRCFEDPEKDYLTQAREYFTAIWEFMLEMPARTVTYIRYYYSPYYGKYSAVAHNQRFMPLLQKFKGNFADETNVAMLLNHMLSTTMLFAMRVIGGELEDNEDTRKHVFLVIHNSISPYFSEKPHVH